MFDQKEKKWLEGGKPARAQDHLGPDVKLEREDLGEDKWAYKMLKEIGKSIKQPGFNYMGSVAIHFYKSDNENIVTDEYSVATMHQLAIGDLNEYITNMGLGNLMVEIKRYYGRVHSTRDTNDKRGQP